MDPQYQFLYSVSPFTQSQALRAANKATQPNVGIKSIKAFLFPLPPLSEQHRIVARVDELMALCLELEMTATTTVTSRRQLLKTTIHETLNEGIGTGM